MVREFDRYVTDERVTVVEDGATRTYRGNGRAWRLHWVRGGREWPQAGAGDTVLAERAVPSDILTAYRSRGIYWLDLAGYTRSREGSPLTEELAAFLGRYGIRLPRDGDPLSG